MYRVSEERFCFIYSYTRATFNANKWEYTRSEVKGETNMHAPHFFFLTSPMLSYKCPCVFIKLNKLDETENRRRRNKPSG